MAIAQVFTVITEFKLDAAGWIAGSDAIQDSAQRLSQSVDQSLGSLKQTAIGIATSLTIGQGGILGALYMAIKASDKFKTSQIAIANLMDQKMPFVSRLQQAEGIMENINDLAQEFALPAEDLLSMTKLLAPMVRTHKVSGDAGAPDFATATDLARNLMKAAPTLGVDTGLIMGQMQRSIGGQASMGDTLFSRLVADTKTMRGMSSQKFNSMDEAKRIDTLRKAFKEFTSDTQVLEANTRTLSGQLRILSNYMSSTFSVMRSVGNVLNDLAVNILMKVNTYIGKHGRAIFDSIAKMIEPIAKRPGDYIVTALALKDLKKHLDMVSTITKSVAMILLLEFALRKLGIRIPMVSFLLEKFASVFHVLDKLFMVPKGFLNPTGIFGSMRLGFAQLTGAMTTMLGSIFLLVLAFQIISRAIQFGFGMAMEKIAAQAERIAKIGSWFVRLFDIFDEGITNIAKSLAWLFDPTSIMGFDLIEGALGMIERIVYTLAAGISFFQSFVFALMELINQIGNVFSGGSFSLSSIGDAMEEGWFSMMDRIFGEMKQGNAVANMTTNIGKVEIKNEFKEQQEPDRIAFALKDQLFKAAQNPTQSSGRTFAGATVGGTR